MEPPFPSLGEALAARAATHPDAPAVGDGSRSLTYAELDRRANGIATAITIGVEAYRRVRDIRNGKATLSNTDRSVNRAPNWNSMPILRRRRYRPSVSS